MSHGTPAETPTSVARRAFALSPVAAASIGGERRVRARVVCLHASGASGAQWKPLAEALGDDFDVLAPDLYGHGRAPEWIGAPSDLVGADAARVARFAAGDGHVHLVGHSYGGAVALRVALESPGRIASLSLYEPVPMRLLFEHDPRSRAAIEVAGLAACIRRELRGGDPERAARRFVDYWAGGAQWAQLARERRRAIVARMPVIDAQFESLASRAVGLRDYARIDAPVLLMIGRDTRASARRIGELLRYAFPHVDSAMMAAMGHLAPVTDAHPVARRIARFIRRHAAGDDIVPRKAA
jgi:pimeloyl-ACP methyl ester carboxylesterase